MLNLNFASVFDTFHGRLVFIIKKHDKVAVFCIMTTSLTLLHHDVK